MLRLCCLVILFTLWMLHGSARGEERPAAAPGRVIPKPFVEKPILLGAHRGGRNLWPENTAYAFRRTGERWPWALLEGDVQMSADGYPILMHDDTVDRTTDGTGPVAGKTLAELKQLDAGYRFTADRGQTFPYRGQGITIPTLDEVIAAAPAHRFLIEIKGGEGAVDAVVKVIREAQAESRFLLASINPMHMHRLREVAPEIGACFDYSNAMVMLKTLREGDWDQYTPPCAMLCLSQGLEKQFNLTPEEAQKIRGKGVLYQVFTVNRREEMQSLLKRGVDSILSDNPELLAQVIDEMPPPAR
jgi:glycerophosphoryl diester phosphodiesterase